MEENEDIKEAKEELNQLSRDEVLRRIALKEELLRMDINQAKADAAKYGREEGRAEGRKEGIEEGTQNTKEKMVKKLYEINMPVAQIAEVVELNIEQVKELIEKIK